MSLDFEDIVGDQIETLAANRRQDSHEPTMKSKEIIKECWRKATVERKREKKRNERNDFYLRGRENDVKII